MMPAWLSAWTRALPGLVLARMGLLGWLIGNGVALAAILLGLRRSRFGRSACADDAGLRLG